MTASTAVPLVEVRDLTKTFDVSMPWLNRVIERKARQFVHAVDGLSFTMTDKETGESAEVSLDALTIEAYSARLDAWHTEIGTFCASRGIHYIQINTEIPWDAILMQALRRQGVVR